MAKNKINTIFATDLVRRFTTLWLLCLLLTPASNLAAVITQYHHVDSSTPASTSIEPDLFRQHIEYLHENSFNVWPLPKLINHLRQGKQLPDKTLAITFDDGYQSVYRNAFPVLKKYNYPFTVFVNTDLVGSTVFMNWQQLNKLKQQGATIANHAANHNHFLRLLKNESPVQHKKRIQKNIEKAEQAIIDKLGESEQLLAYPYGEYNNEIKQIAANLGLIAFSQHSGAFDKSADWQAVPRFAFGGIYTHLDDYIEKVNSLPMPLISGVAFDENNYPIPDPLIPLHSKRPVLQLSLPNPSLAKNINCYATSQGKINTRIKGNIVIVTPKNDIPVGRSRYNCTAASGTPGRYYWHSHFFIRKQVDDSWYPEQ